MASENVIQSFQTLVKRYEQLYRNC